MKQRECDAGPFAHGQLLPVSPISSVFASTLLLDISVPLSPRDDTYLPIVPIKAHSGTYESYIGALCREIEVVAPDFLSYRLSGVRLYGGMPAVMSGKLFRELMRHVRIGFACEKHAELFVELDPNFVTADFIANIDGQFTLYPSVRFVSALDHELAYLKANFRYGTLQDLKELFDCRGIHDFDLQLYYGLHEQTERSITYSLDKCIALGTSHISLVKYQPRLDMRRKIDSTPRHEDLSDRNRCADLYQIARGYLVDQGYLEYAHRHFALPGHESRFFKTYTLGASILGIGLGARSIFEDMELINSDNYTAYINHPQDPSITVACSRILSGSEVETELQGRLVG